MPKIAVAADGDVVLATDLNDRVVTVAWDDIGTANIKLYGRITHTDGTYLDFPIANGELDASSQDDQGNDLKSTNVNVGARTLIAKVSSFNNAFALWIA